MAEMEGKLDVRESIVAKLSKLDQRMDVAEAKEQQEKSLEKEISKSIERGFGIGRYRARVEDERRRVLGALCAR